MLALLIGLVLGFVNGVLTAYLRIPSFITTLAALSAFRGVAFMFNNGSPVSQVSPWLEPIFYGRLAGLPLPLFYVVFLYAAAFWFLRYTATRPLDLCGRRQRQRRPAVRHQCRRSPALRLRHRRVLRRAGAVLMAAG